MGVADPVAELVGDREAEAAERRLVAAEARSAALSTIRRSAGTSRPEQSPRSQLSSIRRPSRSSAIDSTGTGISAPPKASR